MNYSIAEWRIKSVWLDLPLDFDFQEWLRGQPDNEGKRICTVMSDCVHPEDIGLCVIDPERGTWKLAAFYNTIVGQLWSGRLLWNDPKDIDWMGTDAAILYDDILIPLFREFKGSMEAMMVWDLHIPGEGDKPWKSGKSEWEYGTRYIYVHIDEGDVTEKVFS